MEIPEGFSDASGLDAVADLLGSCCLPRAMRAAVEPAIDLGAVADNLALAVLTDRRHAVNGALEAVESVVLPGGDHLKRLVVVVAAHLAGPH